MNTVFPPNRRHWLVLMTGVYLRQVASVKENTVNMINILRWYAVYENIRGFYSYYCPVGVTLSGDGAAPVSGTFCHNCCLVYTTNADQLVL